jgi:ribose transport system substrate-binding protein
VRRSIGLALRALVATTALLGAAACTAAPQPSPDLASTRSVRVGVAMDDARRDFTAAMRAGARQAAGHLGATLVERDAAGKGRVQALQVADLVRSRVDVIVVSPVDGTVTAAVRSAVARGVPVVTANRALEDVPVVSHVCSDDGQGGRTAASFLAQALRGRGVLIDIAGRSDDPADGERGVGFRSVIASYKGLNIVEQLGARDDRAVAERLFAKALARHPRIDGVFARSDEMVLGALDAARAARRTDRTVFVGFGGSREAIAAIDAANLSATVALQPVEIGRRAVEDAVARAAGKHVAGVTVVGLALVTG